MITYEVGGIILGEDQPYLDEAGCRWVVQSERGWSGSPGARMVSGARPRQHGDLDGQSFLTGRSIILGCRVTAPSDAGLRAALRRLAACLADGVDLAPLVVTEDVVQRVLVRRADEIAPVRGEYPTTATFVLSLFAPDPRRYDNTETAVSTGLPAAASGISFPVSFPVSFPAGGVDGSLSILNAGTADTAPVFTITGPCTAPRVEIINTGTVLAFTTTLADGDALTVDCAAGTVTLNDSADRRTDLTPGSSPVRQVTLPPGLSTLLFRASTSPGGATLTTTFRSANW
ncbi:MAG TPA: hypothetical protein VIS06_11525 [Mycobacteriales bacterium]